MIPTFSPSVSLFLAILVSLIVMLGFALIGLKLASRYTLIDFPGSKPHKRHDRPTPIAGGIALIGTLFVAGIVINTYASWEVRAIFLASLPVFIFGLWDDWKDIKVPLKLLGQLLSAFMLIRLGVYIQVFESPELPFYLDQNLRIFLDWFITVFWIVGITNALNFVDSKDGLAVGLAAITAAFFMLMTLISGQLVLSQQNAILLGACIGLFFFNSPPALLFLGDSGAQTLGFFLAGLAIAYVPEGAYQFSSWFVPILLLGVPIFDTFLVIISRLRRRVPIYKAALDHTYHRLEFFGFGSGRAVLTMHFTALALGCLAFVLLHTSPFIANSAFILLLLLGILILTILDRKKYWSKFNAPAANT
jgi:UDP-GlcNAc:undecaprenyl-phosphate GlcNAc-1-phosphate transferase